MAFFKDKKAKQIPPGLGPVKHIIAVASGKGGVGKSTVAANLAATFKNLGLEVGLLDADIYGPSQMNMLGASFVEPEVKDNILIPAERHGIKFVSMGMLMPSEESPVVWRAPMAMKMIQQFIANVAWGELDFLFVDLPPGTGDVQLTLAQQASLTGAVIVTTPQQVALGIAKKGLKMFQQVNVPIIGVVENMSGFICPQCNHQTPLFKKDGGKQMSGEMNVPFLGDIPLDTAIMEAGDAGTPVVIQDPQSKSSQAFSDLAKAIHQELHQISHQMPVPKEVKLSAWGDLAIEWPDGKKTVHKPYTLRVNCGCAVCVDENTGVRKLDPKTVPLDIRIKGMDNVGRYAIALHFSDEHKTGIYTFDKLLNTAESPEKESPSLSF